MVRITLRNSTSWMPSSPLDTVSILAERPILTDAGEVTAEQAKEHAESEFEKYRIIQDRIFESDFDRFELPTLPFDEKN